MGKESAAEIFTKVGRILLDDTAVRWTYAELLGWLNDGIREIIIKKPSVFSTNTVIPLVVGTLQSVPAESLGLLRVVRNLKPGTTETDVPRIAGRAVTIVSREIMDTQSPDWHDTTITRPKPVVKHVIFDEQDPYHFYIYPPNDGTGVVEAVLSSEPPALVVKEGDDAEDLASYSSLFLPIPDVYANVVLDYILYRSYAKDADFAGNTQRSALYYQQFANALGIKVRIDAALSVNAATNTAPPNLAASAQAAS